MLASNNEATKEANEPNHAGNAGGAKRYHFTANTQVLTVVKDETGIVFTADN